VVVGGDFGTTTGTVYAGFMASNWPHSPSLKPEYRYAQTITNSMTCTNSMACTNLNYTLYSNQSQEQLYLTVEETTRDEAIEYYNAKKKIYKMTLQTPTRMEGSVTIFLSHQSSSQSNYNHVHQDLLSWETPQVVTATLCWLKEMSDVFSSIELVISHGVVLCG